MVAMLSFELNDDGKAIQVHCDSEGMGILLEALAGLVKEGGGHVHLRAGEKLSSVSPFGAEALGEVIIDYVEGDPLEDE